MSRRVHPALWLATGIALVLLVGATIAMLVSAGAESDIGTEAYLVSVTHLIHLHEKPSPYSTTVSIQNHGTRVTIKERLDVGNQIWYLVGVDEITGWVTSEKIKRSPP